MDDSLVNFEHYTQKSTFWVLLGVADTIILLAFVRAGLSLRAGGRGFSSATKRVAPGYFYWKIEEK